VFALEFTIPAWVALLAVLFLNERMTTDRTLALAVSFVGVLVILRPGFAGFQPAALIMLAGALFFAITAIMTKKLITTETTFAILFWMNLIQLPLNFACSDWLFFLKIDQSMVLPLIGVTLGGLLTHYCLTNAFRCGDAIVVIPMDFLRLPLIALIGWAFYGEAIDAFVFAGAGFIIAGVLWNVRSESRRNSAAPVTA
jgi:drug/metabolite transporter (DMT)-like permease